MPNGGDRHTDEVTGRVMEWVDDRWTPVCWLDNTPMTDNDDHGWLRCPRCGTKAVDYSPPANTSTLSRARR